MESPSPRTVGRAPEIAAAAPGRLAGAEPFAAVLVLGSGPGRLADALEGPRTVAFAPGTLVAREGHLDPMGGTLSAVERSIREGADQPYRPGRRELAGCRVDEARVSLERGVCVEPRGGTDRAAHVGRGPHDHEEVLATGRLSARAFERLPGGIGREPAQG